jgi:hypothetical protein
MNAGWATSGIWATSESIVSRPADSFTDVGYGFGNMPRTADRHSGDPSTRVTLEAEAPVAVREGAAWAGVASGWSLAAVRAALH